MTTVKFYKNINGKEPVRDWLKAMDRPDCKEIGDDLQTVQLGWKKGLIREPLVKNLGNGLWELRTTLTTHRIARVMFCVSQETIILLHGFIKKTRKTPILDLALAKTRKRTLERNR